MRGRCKSGQMGRKTNSANIHGFGFVGDDNDRNGVLRCLDEHMVRTGNMAVVIIILILAVILWMPRKGG